MKPNRAPMNMTSRCSTCGRVIATQPPHVIIINTNPSTSFTAYVANCKVHRFDTLECLVTFVNDLIAKTRANQEASVTHEKKEAGSRILREALHLLGH